MRKKTLLALASVALFPSFASAADFGDCSYVSANGTTIAGLSCPDAPAPVSVLSGSAVPNADLSALSGSYFPAVVHKDGVYYLSFSALLTVFVWFVAIFFSVVVFYHLSVVSFKSGFSVFGKSRNPS